MREAAAMLLSDAAALKMMSTWARDETIPTVEALRDVERALHGWHNAKSERLDRVRSTDGLCVNGSEVGAGKTAVQVYLLPANNNVSGAL